MDASTTEPYTYSTTSTPDLPPAPPSTTTPSSSASSFSSYTADLAAKVASLKASGLHGEPLYDHMTLMEAALCRTLLGEPCSEEESVAASCPSEEEEAPMSPTSVFSQHATSSPAWSTPAPPPPAARPPPPHLPLHPQPRLHLPLHPRPLLPQPHHPRPRPLPPPHPQPRPLLPHHPRPRPHSRLEHPHSQSLEHPHSQSLEYPRPHSCLEHPRPRWQQCGHHSAQLRERHPAGAVRTLLEPGQQRGWRAALTPGGAGQGVRQSGLVMRSVVDLARRGTRSRQRRGGGRSPRHTAPNLIIINAPRCGRRRH